MVMVLSMVGVLMKSEQYLSLHQYITYYFTMQ